MALKDLTYTHFMDSMDKDWEIAYSLQGALRVHHPTTWDMCTGESKPANYILILQQLSTICRCANTSDFLKY